MAKTPKIISPAKIRRLYQKAEEEALSFEQEAIVSPEIQTKRTAIFTTELKDLVERVKSPQIATSLHLTKDIFVNSFLNLVGPEKEEEHRLLRKLFMPSKRVQESALMDYTSYLLGRVGIDNFSWHFLAYDSQAYYSEISNGVDIITRKNFLFLKTDPYIQTVAKDFFELTVTSDLLKDPFFNKKFSVESISYLSKIYFFFLNDPGVDACLVAFLEKNTTEGIAWSQTQEKEMQSRWLRMVRDKLPILSPALGRYRTEKLTTRVSPDDMLTGVIHAFKTTIGQELNRASIHKIKIENYKDLENAYYLKKQLVAKLLKLLSPKEKILELGISTYLVLGVEDYQEKIISMAREDGIEVSIKTKIYPDSGENILLYL